VFARTPSPFTIVNLFFELSTRLLRSTPLLSTCSTQYTSGPLCIARRPALVVIFGSDSTTLTGISKFNAITSPLFHFLFRVRYPASRFPLTFLPLSLAVYDLHQSGILTLIFPSTAEDGSTVINTFPS